MDQASFPTPPSPELDPPSSPAVGADSARPHGRRPSLRRWLDALLLVSLAINVVGFAILAVRVNRRGGINYLKAQLDLHDSRVERLPFQVDWEARLRKLPDTEGETIFAG